LAVIAPRFDAEAGELTFEPDAVTVLNLGTEPNSLVIDMTPAEREDRLIAATSEPREEGSSSSTFSRGDLAFLASCQEHLPPRVARLAEQLLTAIRGHYAGEMKKGMTRNWINTPDNIIGITIQNRDASLAVHVKGPATLFHASSLDIRPDRGSYVRFKLSDAGQLEDAIQVVLVSAARFMGRR
jgi:hypothetical protein